MSFSDAPISFPGLFGDWQFTVPSKALNIGNGIYWYGILIALGMLGLMSLAILFTEWFPRTARWVAGLAPACFFIFGTHYIVIILLRESGWITWKGEAWDMLWLCLVPVIFAVLAGLFFCMKRFAPRLVPLLGAYGK